eukprot:snap_masked-scaffold_4-processed-gene-2.19-mRNA-1 protein AED:1.00 eAED:1.00 QI:0/0/0/0/1/1/4/0/537
MLSAYFVKLLFFSYVTVIRAELFVTFDAIQQTLGPFNTPRFSENIAKFSGECQIEAPGTVLLPTENPCISRTIQRDISGQVILVAFIQEFGCFEETVFQNLEELGAIAVVNTGARPGGISMYTNYIGFRKDDIQIPILDTSFEFLINIFGRLQQTGENVTIQINSCADENPYEKCYTIYEPLLSLLVIPLALNNLYLSQKGLKSMKITEGTKPRSMFLIFLMFFNLPSTDGFVWITGGKYKTNIAFALIGFNTVMSHLKTSKWLIIPRLLFTQNFFRGILIGLENYLLQPGVILPDVNFMFIVLDSIIGVLFGITNYLFVTNVLKTLELRANMRTDTTRKSSVNASWCTKLTGFGLYSIIKTRGFTEDSASKKTYLLATHLSSWIMYYFGFFILIVIVENVVVDEMITFGRFENAKQLEFCTLSYLTPIFIGLRALMSMCLIKGVIGPKVTKDGTLTNNTATQVQTSKFNSAMSTLPRSPYQVGTSKVSITDLGGGTLDRTNVSAGMSRNRKFGKPSFDILEPTPDALNAADVKFSL